MFYSSLPLRLDLLTLANYRTRKKMMKMMPFLMKVMVASLTVYR